MSGLSHTAKYARGIEYISPSQHAQYLKARGAVYHPDRSQSGSQIYWSPPLRSWLKVYVIERGAREVVEFHATCPCGMVG